MYNTLDKDILDDVLEEIDIHIEDITDTTEKVNEESKDTINTKNNALHRIDEADRKIALDLQLVPKAYINATFNVDKIKDNLRELYYNTATKKSSKKVYRFNDYVDICYGILSSLRMKRIPTRSYIIGAPNGFGKTSFVSESIITLAANGFRVVPYISLEELAYIKNDYETNLLKPLVKEKERLLIRNSDGVFERIKSDDNEYKLGSEYVRKAKKIEYQYNYYEYMNADCLFVKFSSQTSKEVESYMLYQLLSIRADKGLPTIVMIPYSLDIYLKDSLLKEYVWDEILTKTEKENCYDRLFHVSCYTKPYFGGLENKGEKMDMVTGIVEKV